MENSGYARIKKHHEKAGMIKSVAIILKPRVDFGILNTLRNMCQWFMNRNISICFLDNEKIVVKKIFKNTPGNINFFSEKEIHTAADLIVTLGGDGTLIGIARKCNRKSPPIFGVNMGRLGFITEFSKEEIYEGLNNILKNKYEFEKASLFKVKIFHSDKKQSETQSFFINDIVVNKYDISRMFSLSLTVEDESIYNFSGDGLIVSSPIGSTAYSLAAGGPIINPKVKAIVMTPICPHALTHRPLVIPDNCKVGVKIAKEQSPVTLTFDGQQTVTLNGKATIVISKSVGNYAKIIKNPAKTYFQTLKVKFRHGKRGG